MRALILILLALALWGCPTKPDPEEEQKTADGQAQPSEETLEKLKSLGYIQ
jgi:hypothetical protein